MAINKSNSFYKIWTLNKNKIILQIHLILLWYNCNRNQKNCRIKINFYFQKIYLLILKIAIAIIIIIRLWTNKIIAMKKLFDHNSNNDFYFVFNKINENY